MQRSNTSHSGTGQPLIEGPLVIQPNSVGPHYYDCLYCCKLGYWANTVLISSGHLKSEWHRRKQLLLLFPHPHFSSPYCTIPSRGGATTTLMMPQSAYPTARILQAPIGPFSGILWWPQHLTSLFPVSISVQGSEMEGGPGRRRTSKGQDDSTVYRARTRSREALSCLPQHL